MKLVLLLVLTLCVPSTVSLTSTSTSRAVATSSLLDWLGQENRCFLGPTKQNTSVKLTEHGDVVLVETTRNLVPGEVLFRLGEHALWSARDAYSDRDLGGKLRDLALQAGPGFDIVALSGALAAERIRRYKVRRFQGLAPESAGTLVPSKFGSLAQWIWSRQDFVDKGILNDAETASVVQMGVNLLVPLLDVAARRSWTASDDDDEASPESWSRSDLEQLATDSFALVMSLQKSPPPHLLDGVGTLIPDPFIGSVVPDAWPGREEEDQTIIVPLLDAVVTGSGTENAVVGTPPIKQQGADTIWCIATTPISAGELVIARDPWMGNE